MCLIYVSHHTRGMDDVSHLKGCQKNNPFASTLRPQLSNINNVYTITKQPKKWSKISSYFVDLISCICYSINVPNTSIWLLCNYKYIWSKPSTPTPEHSRFRLSLTFKTILLYKRDIHQLSVLIQLLLCSINYHIFTGKKKIHA